ncbi:DNA-binding transcriptional MerR regulator [Stackebrandtia endophytica]|uniref:DNA-binding transcriptional MerR regulator n=1 Tax=Stackebrandtia endophytica TaxID=1496996 RepID=A0A543AQ51_9ACTN|nr:MerR family transcriptional regulator [Stackebrandtia endophytica]TQL74710.1 DNA-binding transcriptional MerR regulator [Stackebrandtia endophytica]
MFAIGDFARLGRVSVRMLRHYDALGLLQPARVDPATGYRFYEARQLSRLNRIVALKELGFNLKQVHRMIDEDVSLSHLLDLFRTRHAELETELAESRARLINVEARMAAIDREGRMPDLEVLVKPIPATRVAELTGLADSYASDDITPVIRPLFEQLCGKLEAASVRGTGPGVATYESRGEQVLIHAAIPVDLPLGERHGVTVVDLPAIEAATLVHHGSMENSDDSMQALARWIEDHGYRSTGFAREISLECPEDEDDWVTELQESIEKRDDRS